MNATDQMKSDVLAHLVERCWDRPLIPNVYRGEYAEAMVLHLLGVDDWLQTDPWATFDLVRKGDWIRGEVKHSAILQSWHKTVPPGKTGPVFTVKPRADGKRPADFYIFALHDEADIAAVDQRDPAQWRFFVVDEARLTAAIGEQKTIHLKTLEGLVASVGHDQLAATVARVVPMWS